LDSNLESEFIECAESQKYLNTGQNHRVAFSLAEFFEGKEVRSLSYVVQGL
jgi:hypothetical protein